MVAYQKDIAYISIKYNSADKRLTEYHFVGPLTRGRSQEVSREIDRDALKAKIEEYWQYVDRSIRAGDLESSDRHTIFMGNLKSWGYEIAAMLFPPELHREIWRIAARSDILLINTNLGEVPWEALYCVNFEKSSSGEFLSKLRCVIQRQLEIVGVNIEGSIENSTATRHLICLDPELVREEGETGRGFLDVFSSKSLKIHETSSKEALKEAAREASVIHWICEHDVAKGLRLCRGEFYEVRDIDVFRFPSNCLLFMLSCGSGRAQTTNNSFSARIAAASNCTVVAPSSVVAAKEAVGFVVDINNLLKDNSCERLTDVWSLLKGSDSKELTSEMMARDCYLLWFGIYGDCSIKLGSIADDSKNRVA